MNNRPSWSQAYKKAMKRLSFLFIDVLQIAYVAYECEGEK